MTRNESMQLDEYRWMSTERRVKLQVDYRRTNRGRRVKVDDYRWATRGGRVKGDDYKWASSGGRVKVDKRKNEQKWTGYRVRVSKSC